MRIIIDIQMLLFNLAQRNITGYYVADLEAAKDKVFTLLPQFCTVGIGNSVTLKDMNLSSALVSKGYTVLDKTLASTDEEARKLKKDALLADWYISGSNAISQEGHIVNIDHSAIGWPPWFMAQVM